jgi:hypothetical protein
VIVTRLPISADDALGVRTFVCSRGRAKAADHCKGKV